jgi:multiple sugar transport system permease protein
MKVRKDTIVKWLYATPGLAAISMFLGIPLLLIFWLSLQYMPTGLSPKFAGVTNFIEVFQLPELYISIQRSIVYSFTAVFLKALIGLGVALLLNQNFTGRGIIRGLCLISYAIPAFVCALIFWFVYDYRGTANAILQVFGLKPFYWLRYDIAMLSVILVNVWHGWPFFFLGLLAGLQAIPIELYESASVDGASSFVKFKAITLPLLKPVFAIVCGLSLMWTMGDFVIPWMLTGGGPVDATLTVPIATYKIAFLTRLNIPLAAAYAMTVLPIFLVIIYYIIRQMEVK